jgi:hypothetical protein
LIAAPLLVVAAANRRIRFAGAAIGAVALVVAPLTAITSGRALGAAVIGSGNTRSSGGTVLWEMHLHGFLLVGISRILPIVLAMALAWWAVRRLGSVALEPLPLASLIATALTLRLVFEQNLFGYYFMAVALLLVVLDVIRGRITVHLVAWIILVCLAFDPLPRVKDVASQDIPVWFWQIVLVTSAAVLAARPLIAAVRDHVTVSTLHEQRMLPLDARGMTGH